MILNAWLNHRKYNSSYKYIREIHNIITSILGENMVNEIHQYVLDKLPLANLAKMCEIVITTFDKLCLPTVTLLCNVILHSFHSNRYL